MRVLFFLPTSFSQREILFYHETDRLLSNQQHDVFFLSTSHEYWNAYNGGLQVNIMPWNFPAAGDSTSCAVADDVLNSACLRHGLWRGNKPNGSVAGSGITGAATYADYLDRILTAIKPDLCVIWNGEYPYQVLLKHLLLQRAVPFTILERGLLVNSFFVDRSGLNAHSEFSAGHTFFPQTGGCASPGFDAIRKSFLTKGETWWEQPETTGAKTLETRLGLTRYRRVVFFPGQVDEDTSCFLFSPIFRRNLDAFEWFVDKMAVRPDIFILGKHHPKSNIPPAAYERIAARHANVAWIDDAAIDDCLAVCNRVAMVNSTVGVEAMFREIPVLSMGQSLLSGWDAYYELSRKEQPDAILDAWLNKEQFTEHLSRFENFISTLQFSLVDIDRDRADLGLFSCENFVEMICSDARVTKKSLNEQNESAETLPSILESFHGAVQTSRRRFWMKQRFRLENILRRLKAQSNH